MIKVTVSCHRRKNCKGYCICHRRKKHRGRDVKRALWILFQCARRLRILSKSDGTCGKCVFFSLLSVSYLFISFLTFCFRDGGWGLIGGGGIELEGGNLFLFFLFVVGYVSLRALF